ncbi:MAG: NapC/NirT family cytochrome c [Acidobacteriaceae bacterium]
MPEKPDESTTGINRPPTLIRNTVSFVGMGVAFLAAINIIFLVFVDYFRPSPYVGIFAYMILPAILIIGLALVPVGAAFERRRRHRLKPGETAAYPEFDLNSPAVRRSLLTFFVFAVVFVALSAAGSYRAYEYSDSVRFCGETCHTVMKPEYNTYLQSPHARVACVECHVGPGAGWYVRSKLSGAYQVYAAMFHKYPRPIPTPVANLRPAQQTCEQCHWPQRFYGAQLKVFTHFGYDEANTPRQIRMLLNIGGAEPRAGMPSGIHWHMNIANQVTYIAKDAQRQVIPWVQIKDREGRVTVYQSKDAPLTPEQVASSSRRLMDCIDCHSRPSHIFTPPDQAVDSSLLSHGLDPEMPSIKAEAVAALTKPYKTSEQAHESITASLTRFYTVNYSDRYPADSEALRQAIEEVKRIYDSTIFPYMKVDWRTHPNNVGHYDFPGCFRCHDGQHVSADGKVIPKDCNTCHSVLAQSETRMPVTTTPSVGFKHPVDLGDLTQVNCSDCHTGGSMQ